MSEGPTADNRASRGSALEVFRVALVLELHVNERTGHPRVSPGVKRDHLNRHVGTLRHRQNVIELPGHDLPAADDPPDRGFVENRPELKRVRAL